jgi:hypothetical protein
MQKDNCGDHVAQLSRSLNEIVNELRKIREVLEKIEKKSNSPAR